MVSRSALLVQLCRLDVTLAPWTIHDQLADGRRTRVLNIVDDYSRVCIGQLVELSISGARMVRYFDELADTRSLRQFLVLDDRPEMISMLSLFLNMVLSHVFVKMMGVPGIALSTAFVYVVSATIIFNYLYKKLQKESWFEVIKRS